MKSSYEVINIPKTQSPIAQSDTIKVRWDFSLFLDEGTRDLIMKKYSYPFLFAATIIFLSLVFLFVLWERSIYRTTFLNQETSRYTILAAMAASFPVALLLVWRGVVKNGRLFSYLKLYAGLSVLMVMFSVPFVITLTYILPGMHSSYTALYEYAYRSRSSCSGAHVDDPDLGKNIRICYPEGNYKFNNEIYVEKRSNMLGAVVTYAATFPHSSH